jgi:hypothetical protein
MQRGKANESNKAEKSSNTKPNTKRGKRTKKKSSTPARKEDSNAAGAKSAKEGTDDSKSKKSPRLLKWESNESLVLLEGWARDGLSMEQIAHNMGIAKDTLYRWLKISSDISDAIKKGKEVTDYLVENALFTSALTGNVVAQIFWLKNRKPDKWKDKIEQVVDTEADTSGVVLLAPVLEKNHEPTEESDLGTTTQTD